MTWKDLPYTLIVLEGPSGIGKSTLAKKLTEISVNGAQTVVGMVKTKKVTTDDQGLPSFFNDMTRINAAFHTLGLDNGINTVILDRYLFSESVYGALRRGLTMRQIEELFTRENYPQRLHEHVGFNWKELQRRLARQKTLNVAVFIMTGGSHQMKFRRESRLNTWNLYQESGAYRRILGKKVFARCSLKIKSRMTHLRIGTMDHQVRQVINGVNACQNQ